MRSKGTGEEVTGTTGGVCAGHHERTPTAHREHTFPHPPFPNTPNPTTQCPELPPHTNVQHDQPAPSTLHLSTAKPTSAQTESNPHRAHERRYTTRTTHPPEHPSRSSVVQRPDQTVEHRTCWTASERDATIPPLSRNCTRRVRRVLEVRHAWTHGSQL